MKIGIHSDKSAHESYSDKWREYLIKYQIETKEIDLLGDNVLDQVKDCGGVMCRWIHYPDAKQSLKQILRAIEQHLEIPIFPDLKTSWHYDNKIAQKYLLEFVGEPMVKTWIFWDLHKSISWLNNASYPIVGKLKSGAGSANVFLIKDKKQSNKFVNKIFKKGIFPYTLNEYSKRNKSIKAFGARIKYAMSYILNSQYPPINPPWWEPEHSYAYFQEFIENNKFDTRITIIGNRAFGFRRFNRPNNFRASGSGLIDYNPDEINLNCVKSAFEISKKGQFQSMAYDFLLDEENTQLVCEISYTFKDLNVFECPGYWDSDLKWTPCSMWPQEAQVIDFIQYLNSYESK